MVRSKIAHDMSLTRRRRPRPNPDLSRCQKIPFKSSKTQSSKSSKRRTNDSYQPEEESRYDKEACNARIEIEFSEEREDDTRDCDTIDAGRDRKLVSNRKRLLKRDNDSTFVTRNELAASNRTKYDTPSVLIRVKHILNTTKIVNFTVTGAILTIFAMTRDVFILRFLSLLVIGNIVALCRQWIHFFADSPSFSKLAGINRTMKQIVFYQYNKTVEGGTLRRKMELVVVGVYHEFIKWFYHWWYYSE